jgi:hypothetical protein
VEMKWSFMGVTTWFGFINLTMIRPMRKKQNGFKFRAGQKRRKKLSIPYPKYIIVICMKISDKMIDAAISHGGAGTFPKHSPYV